MSNRTAQPATKPARGPLPEPHDPMPASAALAHTPDGAPPPVAAGAPRTEGATLLAEITAGLADGSDLRALLERLLDPVVRLSGARAGAVRVLSDDGGRLCLVGGLVPAVATCSQQPAVDRHCGVCGAAADGPQLVWGADPRTCARPPAPVAGEQAPHRMLAVPLQHKGRVLGVYNLFFDDDTPPGPEISVLLRSVGELLGLALDNARLEAENLRAMVMHERQMMAAEVHDSMAQTLTYVKMRLPLLEDALAAHDDARARRYLGDVRSAVGEAHASLREIVTHFRTRIDPRGLMAALDELALRFPPRSGIALHFRNRLPGLRLGEAQEADVFHVVQEALANIERHSGARQAWLRIEPLPAGAPGDAPADAPAAGHAQVQVLIEDDGLGARTAPHDPSHQGHHGICIMGERAQRLGGTLRVGPRPGGGTQVRLRFPAPATTEPAR